MATSSEDWLVGGGEMGELIRAMDWSATPLGARACWPQSLRTAAALMVVSPLPQALLWGRELILLYNDACRMLVADRHPRALGRSMRESWPEFGPTHEVISSTVIERGESVRCDDQPYAILRNGQREDATFTLGFSPVRVENGTVGGCLASLLETKGCHPEPRMRARASAEVPVRRERELLAALIRSIPDEVWFADTQKRFILLNPAAQREFALEKHGPLEVESFTASLHVLRPDGTPRPIEEAPVLRALAGETLLHQEEQVRTPASGELRWRQLSASPVRDGNGAIMGSVVVVRDITERKQAEQALRQSKELRTITESMPQLVWEVAADGRPGYFNRRWSEYTGLDPNSLMEKGLHYLIHPEDYERMEKAWGEAVRTGTFYECKYRIRRHDGQFRWNLSRAFPLCSSKGEMRWFGTTTEIHELVEAQQALQKLNEKLEEADRRKNEFLGMLSHELRNPLTPICNSLYVLDRAVPGGEQAKRAKTIIDRQVGHLSHLINDLLDVTRLSRNKIQLHCERTDLCDLVRRSAEDQGPLFDGGQLRLEVELPAEPIVIEADTTRMAQIVSNLLQNAAKFTHGGGVTRVSASIEGGQAVMRVSDTGAGMTADMMAALFQPFVQADKTLDRSGGGLGLGLALVKGLVELHGGEVSAHSEGLGQGAEFVVTLPLAGAAKTHTEAVSVAAPLPRRILLIEDNVDAAESLRQALELCGHEVMVAHNGPDGISKAREGRPGYVFCDIGLPGMNGYEVAQAFRGEEALKHIRLFALSGYALPEDVQRSAEAGFEQHIAKPPSLASLAAILGTAQACTKL